MIVPCAPPSEIAREDQFGYCCGNAAERGVGYCTCWVPVFDLEQAEPDTATEATTRAKCCHDCAFRNGSVERNDDYEGEALLDIAHGHGEFFCHQGMRRAVTYRHPDGREVPAGDLDYQPPVVDGVPYLANGHAGERCAGWAAHRNASAVDLTESGTA